MPTSVALSSLFKKFVRSQVGSGRYNNVSEVVHAGLRIKYYGINPKQFPKQLLEVN